MRLLGRRHAGRCWVDRGTGCSGADVGIVRVRRGGEGLKWKGIFFKGLITILINR